MKLAPEIMDEVFEIIECPYSLRNELRFDSRYIRTVRYGIETADFVGSRIWSYKSFELKERTSLNKFRSKIKTWKPENCLWKLCTIYLQRNGCLKVTDQSILTDAVIYTSLFVCLFVLLGFCLFVLLGFFLFVFVLLFAFFPFFF